MKKFALCLCAVGLAATAFANNETDRLKAADSKNLKTLEPLRWKALGGEWNTNVGSPNRDTGDCLVFDQIWPDNDSSDNGSDITPLQDGTACGLPGDGYRWVFASTTLNIPVNVEDIQIDAAYANAGVCVDRFVIIASINSGFAVPPPAENLAIAVAVADTFNDCNDPNGPASDFLTLCNNPNADLLIFDYGAIAPNNWILNNTVSDPNNALSVPADGSGAVAFWLVSYTTDAGDPNDWIAGTAFKPWMWGTRSNAPVADLTPSAGDSGDLYYIDADANLGIDTVTECFTWLGWSGCPDPAGPMILLISSQCNIGGGCAGDLTGDSQTDFADFAQLSSCWGQACGDLTGDATTDFADFAALSADWNCGL